MAGAHVGDLDPPATAASVACIAKTDRYIAMNCSRLLITTLAIVFSLSVRSVRSQEAVESRPEEPTIELTPTPTEETRAENAPEAAAKETSTKRTKKKAAAEESTRVLQDAMTADEFKAAGLDKLSAEELKNLNAWLQGYRHTAETKAAEKATAEVKTKAVSESRAKMDSILSRVDGTFTGLTGHTVIKLEDGTIWKQANADDRYRAQVTDHPPVKVSRGTFGYKMRVVGTAEFYVDPVR